MPRTRSFAVYTILGWGVALLAAYPKAAQAATDRFGDTGSIELNFEPAAVANPTPHGFLGISASYSPLPVLAIRAGLGSLNQSAGVCQELREHCLAEHASAPGFPLLDVGLALGYWF